jgi:hypothetical protein
LINYPSSLSLGEAARAASGGDDHLRSTSVDGGAPRPAPLVGATNSRSHLFAFFSNDSDRSLIDL